MNQYFMRMLTILLLSGTLFLTGCTSAPSDEEDAVEDEETASESEPSHNVIKEYVNTPKEKARGVANKVEAKQAEAADQARKIAGDE